MTKLFPLFLLLLVGCKVEKKEDVNFRTENIEIRGELHKIKTPSEEIYYEANYDETQASKTIYINLNDRLKEKITLTELETLINFQGKYIIDQQKLNKKFFEMDEMNINFLEKKAKSIGVNLSKEEILKIFDTELYYMKLINIID